MYNSRNAFRAYLTENEIICRVIMLKLKRKAANGYAYIGLKL